MTKLRLALIFTGLLIFFMTLSSMSQVPVLSQTAEEKIPAKKLHWSKDPNASQTDMNIGAGDDYKQADQELNRVYHKILKDYKDDTVFLAKLKKAQLAWIAFRDAHMEARYPLNSIHEYGTVYTMCYYIEKTELVEDRIAQLKKWIEGSEEGNVCSGSYHMKQ